MLQIDLTVGSRYQLDRKKVRSKVEEVLRNHGITHARVDISIVGVRKIRQLNESRLAHQGVTDVLSFPLHEKKQLEDFPLPSGIPPHLGDIVICYPAAVDQAKKFGKLVDDQLCFLAEHGLLHLLGYHHE